MRIQVRVCKSLAIFMTMIAVLGVVAQAQAPPPPPSYPPAPSYPAQPPPSYPPQELDRLVQRIALYPDPLLAQILAAATFPDQIPDAARWSDEHHYLTGPALAQAITADQLPWDPSVQALLPFPSVLGMMASDMAWTQELGNAFLAQQPDVMDAVQQERHIAWNYGYLRTNPQVIDSARESGLRRGAVLQSAGCVRRAAAGLFCRRRHQFRIWRDHRGGVPALGLGFEPLRLEQPRGFYQ